jgi:uncharacterized protein YggE
LLLVCGTGWAQTSGNIGYEGRGGKANAEQHERTQRVLSKEDLPPTANSMFVDADVLMNVKADEYVAVFGLSQEGKTVQEASGKMDAAVREFTASLAALHVRAGDVSVDLVTEPKLYGYEVKGDVARERLEGFELKKNVSVHYTDPALLDQLMEAAAKSQIYDLIKVDYVVKDIAAVEAKLRREDAAVIKEKLAAYAHLLGTRVKPLPEVIADRSAIYYPSQLYDSYTAAESESVSRPANLSRLTVQQARKGRTFFFNGLDGNGFDRVVNPVVTEPVVQFTLYLKVKYEVVR